MYICKDGGCQAIWHSMIQRMNMNINMTTNVLTLALVVMTLTANAQQKAKTFSITPKAGITASSF